MNHPPVEKGIAVLTAIRGTFGEPMADKVGKAMFCSLFLLGFPALFVSAIFTHGQRGFPVGIALWCPIVLTINSVAFGVIYWRITGQKYVFDGTTIRQVNRFGKVVKEIRISELIRFYSREAAGKGGPKRLLRLQSEGTIMMIPLYPRLLNELQKPLAFGPQFATTDRVEQHWKPDGS
jgi:hypothetical protein